MPGRLFRGRRRRSSSSACLAFSTVSVAAHPRLGVGSGAIALALKDERPDARVVRRRRLAEALSLARENAAALGLDVELREGDMRPPATAGISSSRTRRTSTR